MIEDKPGYGQYIPDVVDVVAVEVDDPQRDAVIGRCLGRLLPAAASTASSSVVSSGGVVAEHVGDVALVNVSLCELATHRSAGSHVLQRAVPRPRTHLVRQLTTREQRVSRFQVRARQHKPRPHSAHQSLIHI